MAEYLSEYGSSGSVVALGLGLAVSVLLIVLLHEIAHALVGALLGFSVAEISIGFGPVVSQVEVRGVVLRIRRMWLTGGFVHCATPHRTLYRTRWVVVLFAGSAVPLSVAWFLRSVAPVDGIGRTVADVFLLVAVGLTLAALIPSGGEESSDGRLILDKLAMDRAAVRLEAHRSTWLRAILRTEELLDEGRHDEFKRVTEEFRASYDESYFSLDLAATAKLIDGDIEGALVDAECALELAHEMGDALFAARIEATIARLLALIGDPASLERAERLARQAPDDVALACVLARAGRTEEAVELLNHCLALVHRPLERRVLTKFRSLASIQLLENPSVASDAAE